MVQDPYQTKFNHEMSRAIQYSKTTPSRKPRKYNQEIEIEKRGDDTR